MDEQYGKSGTLVCANARFTFGMCGLARTPDIEIRRWLSSRLADVSKPDAQAGRMLERLAEVATSDFATNPALRAIPASDKLVSFLFSGYIARPVHRVGFAVITNTKGPSPGREFEVNLIQEKLPLADDLASIQGIGGGVALPPSETRDLRMMLAERKPAKAIIERAIDLMLRVSDTPGARGTIGKQIDWIRLPASPEPSESGYYSNVTSYATYMPVHIVARPSGASVVDGVSLVALDPSQARPLHVKKVKRDARCPCGSGKKYKNCHARG